MEISGQTTDLAGAIAQAKTAIEAGAEAARQAFSRIEAQLKSGGSTKELAEVLDGIHVIAADVDKLCKNSGGPSLEPLQQKVARIEVAVAAVAQRLENSEVQKSLLRLEDATQKTRDEVHQLRGDGLGKATTQLQDRLDKATKGLADGLQQMRDGNLGGLENGMREIQRELSGVATAVSQIQASVRSGKGSMAAASAPAPAPAAPPAAPATPAAAPAANAGKGDDANANYQTGARSTSGKNVLGAIAKLKQMKN
jgi:nucleoid-associated protein YgaU